MSLLVSLTRVCWRSGIELSGSHLKSSVDQATKDLNKRIEFIAPFSQLLVLPLDHSSRMGREAATENVLVVIQNIAQTRRAVRLIGYGAPRIREGGCPAFIDSAQF